MSPTKAPLLASKARRKRAPENEAEVWLGISGSATVGRAGCGFLFVRPTRDSAIDCGVDRLCGGTEPLVDSLGRELRNYLAKLSLDERETWLADRGIHIRPGTLTW